jgi:dynactin complex subunit
MTDKPPSLVDILLALPSLLMCELMLIQDTIDELNPSVRTMSRKLLPPIDEEEIKRERMRRLEAALERVRAKNTTARSGATTKRA